jgi:hypothetical protein
MNLLGRWRRYENPLQIEAESEEATVTPGAIAAPATLELPSGPYLSSDAHLWDELRRIDLLIRAQTVRWRLTIGTSKPQHLWGMVHVTDAEVNAYLCSPFMPPHQLPTELCTAVEIYWQMAERLAEAIERRLTQRTPPVRLRLSRLQELFSLSPLERDILLVCLLSELDGRYRRLFGYLQDDASRTRPCVELVLQILQPLVSHPESGRTAFDAGAPLLAPVLT